MLLVFSLLTRSGLIIGIDKAIIIEILIRNGGEKRTSNRRVILLRSLRKVPNLSHDIWSWKHTRVMHSRFINRLNNVSWRFLSIYSAPSDLYDCNDLVSLGRKGMVCPMSPVWSINRGITQNRRQCRKSSICYLIPLGLKFNQNMQPCCLLQAL